MRVAMTGTFPLDPDRIPGGVEAVIRSLIVHLASEPDMDLHLISCVPGLKAPETRSYHGATIHYLPGQEHLGHLTNHFLEQKRIAAKLIELDPDIVHAHGTGRLVAAAQRTSYPLVVTVHGIRHREVVLFGGIKGAIRRWSVIRLERQVLARAKHIFTIANYVRDAIAPMTRARMYPIANPVDLDLFSLPTRDDGHTILSVAAIQPRKGLVYLVEALARVKSRVPDARLLIIGKVLDEHYDRELKNRIEELDLAESVEIRGFVPDEELREAFSGCACFALCSVEESSPVSIAEAMTLGKPVVATAVGGVPDLVDEGRTGYLVPFADVAATASALEKILADPGLRARFGASAREHAVAHFHPRAIAQQTVAVYRRILEDNRKQT